MMGLVGGSPVVSARACGEPRLDKSFVSAEGRNVSLCCGFEVRINVRCEELARCCEGKDSGGGGAGWL